MSFRRTVLAIALFVVAFLSTLGASAAQAGSLPAVDIPNVTSRLGYRYARSESDSQRVSLGPIFGPLYGPIFAEVRLPEVESHGGRFDLELTLPLRDSLGGRLFAGVGVDRVLVDLGRFLRVDDKSVDARVDAGFDLFLRDPELGFVDVGFVYGFVDEDRFVGDESHSLGVDFETGLFTAIPRLLPIDLVLGVDYTRSRLDSELLDAIDQVGLSAAIRMYPTDRLEIAVGPRVDFDDLESTRNRTDSGFVSARFLLPTIGGGPGDRWTIDLAFAGGSRSVRSDGFRVSLDQHVLALSLGVSFLSQPVESLVQLNRERR